MAVPYRAGYAVVDAFVPMNIIVQGHSLAFENFVIAGGQLLLPGSVLGLVTATNKLVLSAAAAGDGSQVPMAILLEPLATYDVDGTTARDTPFKVLVHGFVNPQALQLGAGHTIATVKPLLRTNGIYIETAHYSG